MAFLDFFRRSPDAQVSAGRPMADGESAFWGLALDDPALVDYLRGGVTSAGSIVGPDAALRNMATWRCVDLIAGSMGMLPLYLRKKTAGKIEDATNHPLYDVLVFEPNNYQSPFDFKAYMQKNALIAGDAYALVIRSNGRILRLVPLDPARMTWRQNTDWSITYTYSRERGGPVDYPQGEIFHLRGLTHDGISGISRVKLAREAIGVALAAERAAARLFRNGVLAGGVLSHPKTLSDPAIERLRQSLRDKSGADKAHEWLVAEEGLKLEAMPSTALNSQHVEQRGMQIEEIARAFGVPRPLLGMDDTTWGSGVEQLAVLFVRFGLAPWFTAWEQAIGRTCLTLPEKKQGYSADFNERELLRGSMKDQSEFFAKALGAGGQRAWMTSNEVRDVTGLGRSSDPEADRLSNPMTQPPGGAGTGAPGNGAA